MTTNLIPPRLQEIIEEFSWAEGSEKLQLLLEFAEKMPPLPDWLNKSHNMEQIHECMTPVFVHAELENGGMVYYFDIPREAPTVRGYASLLSEGLKGEKPEVVINLSSDFYQAMGLQEVISHQRLRGLHAILSRLKKLATPHVS